MCKILIPKFLKKVQISQILDFLHEKFSIEKLKFLLRSEWQIVPELNNFWKSNRLFIMQLPGRSQQEFYADRGQYLNSELLLRREGYSFRVRNFPKSVRETNDLQLT